MLRRSLNARAVVAASIAAAVAVCLPSVRWAPLNIDEELTLDVAPRPWSAIIDIVWGHRGGGPLHFLIEHVTLAWPGGLDGLRLPSLLFFVAALPAATLVARELCGATEALVTAPALAVAPLAVTYATFGRPHLLFLAAFLWALALALRAARTGGRLRWAVAGALLGGLVYVHPTAPLYGVLALVAALVYAPVGIRRLVSTAWPGPVTFALAGIPYYTHALGVLDERYGVGAAAPRGRTYSGASVVEEALRALTPSSGAVLFVVLSAAGVVALFVRRRRSALVLALLVVGPVVFFSVISAGSSSAVFFDRYMLPALPAALMLVASGCVALARLTRGNALVLTFLVAGVVGLELRDDARMLVRQHGLGLTRVGEIVRAERDDSVLFETTGTLGARGAYGQLTPGRPPRLLDRYLALDVPGLRVDDDDCSGTNAFLAEAGAPRRQGVWIFYLARGRGADRAERLLTAVRGVGVQRVAGSYVLVRSLNLVRPRELAALDAAVRRAWMRTVASAGLGQRADRTRPRCRDLASGGPSPGLPPA